MLWENGVTIISLLGETWRRRVENKVQRPVMMFKGVSNLTKVISGSGTQIRVPLLRGWSSFCHHPATFLE